MTPTAGERDVLGLMLMTQAQVVVDVLRTGGESGYSPLAAVTATRGLAGLAGDILHTLVLQAKDDGHTWAEIGDVLHTTRQAAYQRFGLGRANDPEETTVTITTTDAAERAKALFALYTTGKYDEMRANFDERMSEALSGDMIRYGWEQVGVMMGQYKSMGEPAVKEMQGHTVVDIPMEFREGSMKGRVAFDPDGKVAGLFILNPEVP